ncbi:MAG TPA: PD-(D/E)XK nuclease family protein, partial [Verrucomicrobiae bacterium]|nr:PD-(D/E)XK nuclease family protein [Verrucomicrobiae bacterium]
LGTAHHKFLQFISLPRVSSVDHLRQEAIRLQHAHILSSQEAAGLNFDALANFWISELGKKISGQPDSVRRELAFTARFAPSELAGKSPEMEPEFVVVQGVVDLAVVLPRELWVVDFKTDTFAKTELTAKVHAYEPQLILYVRALERIFHRPVTGCWLHFLSHGTSVRVNSGQA